MFGNVALRHLDVPNVCDSWTTRLIGKHGLCVVLTSAVMREVRFVKFESWELPYNIAAFSSAALKT